MSVTPATTVFEPDAPSDSAGRDVLVLTEIRKSYGPVEVLHGVDFRLRQGEVHALVGENGAGKSTLMSIIAGEQPDFGGSYSLYGEEVRLRNVRDAQASGIVLIHQHPTGLPPLSVAENVFAGDLPRRGGFVRWNVARRLARDALGELGLDLDVSQPLARLRPGQQQLVEIARALRQQPRVLILDEPTASLTASEKRRLFEAIARIKAGGTAVIFISHHLSEVFTVADCVTVMRDGRRVRTLLTSETSEDEVAFLMVGRELDPPDDVQRPRTGRRRLCVEALRVADRLRSVSFTADEGEVLGITGLLGAGQDELVGALFGTVVSTGTMTLDDEPYRPVSPAEAIGAGVALVTEDRQADGLLLDESIATNLALVASYRKRFALYRPGREQDEGRGTIDRLGVVPSDPRKPVRALSGGNQQKVAIGKWLRASHRLLILYEPTRGVDVGAKAQVHEIVRELARQGQTVLLVSSDLPEVAALADRVLVLHRGAVGAELAAGQVTDDRLLAISAGVGAKERTA